MAKCLVCKKECGNLEICIQCNKKLDHTFKLLKNDQRRKYRKHHNLIESHNKW